MGASTAQVPDNVPDSLLNPANSAAADTQATIATGLDSVSINASRSDKIAGLTIAGAAIGAAAVGIPAAVVGAVPGAVIGTGVGAVAGGIIGGVAGTAVPGAGVRPPRPPSAQVWARRPVPQPAPRRSASPRPSSAASQAV
ncbi:hypothetical protein ABIA39_002840 [Nocardia sp. GAS34]|uniref:hypothetical protein n=1 Tax=unclassified Nocardia TaxID=2637762 RepID=UPI003D225772